jgi:hypothetical protein
MTKVPENAEVVQTFEGTVLVMDPYEELLKDAHSFKNLAEELPEEKNNDFERWRYLRASIIHSFIALESYIDKFIKEALRRDDVSKAAKNFLKEDKLDYMAIFTKLTVAIELITHKGVDTSISEYQNFIRLKKIRDKLVHYKGDVAVYTEDLTIKNAEQAIVTVKNIIKKIHELDETDYPPFIDRI